MRVILILFGLMSVFFSASSYSQSNLFTKKHFSIVNQLVAKDKQLSHTLIVLDDDDTLTMMPCPSKHHCQYLGGPAWYQWQSQLPASSHERIAKNTPELIAINTLIFSVTHMPVVERDTPMILRQAHKRGAHILVATARGYDMLSVTEQQLKEDGILTTIQSAALRTPSGKITLSAPYIPKEGKRKITYQNGILYLAGQNKGIMLKDFLRKMRLTNQVSHIIFIDDTIKNVKQMAAAYANDAKVRADCIYYTRLKKHKAAFLTGKHAKKLQQIANQRWKHIHQALKNNLPGFYLEK